MYITTSEQLAAFAQRASQSSVLAIDTEFLREKTYAARLCLLQMATEEESVIVDPFEVGSLESLSGLLRDEGVMKLFHAGTQDVEILYHETGVTPWPLFDTQIAASLLGHVQQIGYASLVQAECGVSLKKIDSFTDWSRRPLSKSQIEYAADDVLYLPKMYGKMRAQLEDKGRLSWLDQDFRELADPEKYQPDSRGRYRRLKRVSQLNRRQLSAARELAAWREDEARRRDLPRKWVMTDEQIVEACKREARSIDDLFMVRGISDKVSTKSARKIVESIAVGLDAPEDAWPEADRSRRNEPNVDFQVDLMTALVRLRARQNDIAFQTLASHGDLVAVARGKRKDVDLLKGWRRAIVGEELLDLIDGNLVLGLEEGRLKVTDIRR